MNFLEPSESYRIIDISQPVSSRTACFPGDTPFSRQVTVAYAESQVINLTAITMSPHVGTHADAPVHIRGEMNNNQGTAGMMPVGHFLGPCRVIDIAPCSQSIGLKSVADRLQALDPFPRRVLFKTSSVIRFDTFEDKYASFSVDLIEYLAGKGVLLMGIDSQSVDDVGSKILTAHKSMLSHQMVWLENLDLTKVDEGNYFLIALPLKLMEVEASPVRAVLLAQS